MKQFKTNDVKQACCEKNDSYQNMLGFINVFVDHPNTERAIKRLNQVSKRLHRSYGNPNAFK